ncbi:hypothetical protein AHiyo8_40910 [Arthrobacter sp. Hiyo8]|nr:hypothetical protein AHiyo8_40910 [Arthrobacter sp. Hiyo8]
MFDVGNGQRGGELGLPGADRLAQCAVFPAKLLGILLDDVSEEPPHAVRDRADHGGQEFVACQAEDLVVDGHVGAGPEVLVVVGYESLSVSEDRQQAIGAGPAPTWWAAMLAAETSMLSRMSKTSSTSWIVICLTTAP